MNNNSRGTTPPPPGVATVGVPHHHQQQQRQQQQRSPPRVSHHRDSNIPHGFVPAFLPGSASLVEELDQRLMVVLRDGRHFVGILRSFDQFSNMVLEETRERQFLVADDGTMYYSDHVVDLFVVRGDSIVLMGQVAPDHTHHQQSSGGIQVSQEKFQELKQEQTNPPPVLQWDFDTDLTA